MPCHDTKDNAGFYRFIPPLYPILEQFYWNNNLSYVLASQTQQKRPTPVFIKLFFKIQNYCFASPTVRAKVTICLEKLTDELS